jgi:olfactory receptor
LRSAMLIVPFSFLTKRLPYCWGKLIPHTYCEHVCGQGILWWCQGQCHLWTLAALFIWGFDMFCISVCYTMILWTVVSLSSVEACRRAFGTCTSHLCAIVITYVPVLVSIFTHWFGEQNIPHYIHIIIANLYLLCPPTLNYIVYGVKTK